MEYRSFNDAMRRRFGTKVYRLALQSGCTCPNRDGTIGTGGCTFCSEGGSGEFAASPAPVAEQIAAARRRVDPKIPASIPAEDRRYIAYFQSYTNTYGDPEELRALYAETLAQPQIAALDLGTRPDCLPPEMIRMLTDLGQTYDKPIWIELGLQTIHEETALRIHRGYRLPVFEDAYRRLKETCRGYGRCRRNGRSGENERFGENEGSGENERSRENERSGEPGTGYTGLEVIVHVILGLPGESREDMLETIRYLAGLDPALDGIKLQLLHILKGTQMAEEYAREPFPLFTQEEYCDLVVDCLRMLPPETVVHRLTGDGPRRLLVAPLWSTDKKGVLNMLSRKIREA